MLSYKWDVNITPSSQGSGAITAEEAKKNIVRAKGCQGWERSNVFWAWQDGCTRDLKAGHGRMIVLMASRVSMAGRLHS